MPKPKAREWSRRMSTQFIWGAIFLGNPAVPVLSKCQKWVLKNIEHLLWKNQRVTTVEISTWGRAYHKENPGAAKRIAGALNLFAKSLAQLLAALCS